MDTFLFFYRRLQIIRRTSGENLAKTSPPPLESECASVIEEEAPKKEEDAAPAEVRVERRKKKLTPSLSQ